MATIKPYLDKRKANARGLYSLRIAVNHHGNTSFISLKIELKANQWDAKRCVVVNHPQKAFLNSFINCQTAAYQQALLNAHLHGVRLLDYTATQIRDYLIQAVNPASAPRHTFKSVFDAFINAHTNKRTRDIYDATWRKMKAYDTNAESLTFEQINRAWIDGFFAWLAEKSPSVNARNIHLRNIRAIFNDAIDNEYTDAYPFRRIKIRPVQTAKRNLKVEELRNVFNTKLDGHRQKYLDVFRLSFFLVGINMADLLSLTPTDLQDGRIVYNRKKTHRLYSIKVEPEANFLIEKYKGTKLLLSFAEKCQSYRHFYLKINPVLKTVMDGLTTYYARHSWATIAASLDIPKDTIAQALGHTQTTVTDIYIEYDRSKVDEANRRVIDWVLYGKR